MSVLKMYVPVCHCVLSTAISQFVVINVRMSRNAMSYQCDIDIQVTECTKVQLHTTKYMSMSVDLISVDHNVDARQHSCWTL